MHTAQPLTNQSAAPAVRWAARILSSLILLFWGFMLIEHLVGDAGRPSRPLVWQDTAILTTLMVSLLGLVLAWKWELPGAALTLAAISLCAVFNWKVLVFPGTLIPIAAALFLTGWCLSRAPRRDTPILQQ